MTTIDGDDVAEMVFLDFARVRGPGVISSVLDSAASQIAGGGKGVTVVDEETDEGLMACTAQVFSFKMPGWPLLGVSVEFARTHLDPPDAS
jgi:hypothetical protein